MLGADEVDDRLGGAVTVENLALAEDDVLLQVHGDSLGSTEILHGLGNLDPEVVSHHEVSVDGMSGGKDDGREIQEIDPLRPEFPRGKGFDGIERFEVDPYSVFFGQRYVWGSIRRLFLRNKYLVDSHLFVLFVPSSMEHQSSMHPAINAPVGMNSRAQRYKKVVKGPQYESKI